LKLQFSSYTAAKEFKSTLIAVLNLFDNAREKTEDQAGDMTAKGVTKQ